MQNSENDSLLKPGTLIGNGRYQIADLLGKGGMGAVYTCKRKDLNDRVFAIKVLNPEVSRNKKTIERFQNEVAAAFDVSHKHVIRGYDYIREGDLVAYTMEFVEGGDLTRLIKMRSELSIQEAVRIITEIVEGVQALHEAGIIHRDLKPENVLLTSEDLVKISDFGIAILEQNDRKTSGGQILGTTIYLSPEYLLKNQIDKRSDIYSIGIIAYEILTKQHPFSSENIYQSIYKQIEYSYTPLKVLRPDCPAALSEIISRCLNAKPADRYSNCKELLSDLKEALSTSAAVAREIKTRDLLERDIKNGFESDLDIKAASSFVTEESENQEVIARRTTSDGIRNKFSIISGKFEVTSEMRIKRFLEKLLLILAVLGLNVIALALLYPHIEVNIKTYFADPKDEFALRQEKLESISKTNISWHETEKSISEITTNILHGHIRNISIKISPKPGKFKKHNDIFIQADLKSKSFTEIGSGVYYGFLDGKLFYQADSEVKTQAINGKLNAIIFNDTGLVTINYILPVNAKKDTIGADFNLRNSEDGLIIEISGESNFNILD